MIIESNDCALLKECLTLVKSKTISVRSSKKYGQVRFTAFNDATNVLLYHQIQAEVKEDFKFAVATERLVALLCRKDTQITLTYDGKALNYQYRGSKGLVETFGFDAHENPQIEKDKSLTKALKQNSSYLSLKSSLIEGISNFIFIEEGDDTYLVAADSGAYHAVFIKQKGGSGEPSSLTLPQDHVQNAIRALKEDIQICSVGEHLFCYTKNEGSVSIIRFRNMAETSIKMGVIKECIDSKDVFKFDMESTIFDDVISNYKTVEDKERGGSVRIDVLPKSVKITCETRHGRSGLDFAAKTGATFSFSVSIKLLMDILRFKGTLSIAVKESRNIMTLKQTHKDTEVTFMCSIEKHA